MTPKRADEIVILYDMVIYYGAGAFVPGVPARDMSPEEWEALPADLREQAASLYLVPQEGK